MPSHRPINHCYNGMNGSCLIPNMLDFRTTESLSKMMPKSNGSQPGSRVSANIRQILLQTKEICMFFRLNLVVFVHLPNQITAWRY